MAGIREAFDRVVEAMEEMGRADAVKGAPLPGDERLWEVARERLMAAVAAEWRNRPDGELRAACLEFLPGIAGNWASDMARRAYLEGRRPGRFDLREVAALVRQAGVPAELCHSPGRGVTLYAGADGDVSAGPGHLPGLDAYGYEFHVGTDDEQAAVPLEPTAQQVADLIVGVVRERDADVRETGWVCPGCGAQFMVGEEDRVVDRVQVHCELVDGSGQRIR